MIRGVLLAAAAATVIAGIGIGAAAPAVADGPYKNCTQAHEDGRYNIPQDDPDYASKLDRDGDGYACEPKP